MRKKILHFRLLLLFPFVCLPPTLLLAQSNPKPTLGANDLTDTITLNLSKDSMPGRQVQLLYNKVPRNLTATSTDAVYYKDLIKSPVTSPFSAMVGRLAGVNFSQNSGQPLQDAAGFSLHGRNPIVLIDGVARNLNAIDLEEIESITVLKDAVSTAMLGVRGANGAISIVTRKGSIGRSTVSITAQTGIQKGLGMVKPLNAYNYGLLKNEAITNELKTNPTFNGVKYSDADLLAYKNGTDSIGHPNVDWQSQLFKNTSTINRYNLTADGGNKFSTYFVSLEHLNQSGFLKTSPKNKYNTNNGIKSYIARANIALNITPKISAGISLFGRIINTNEPGGIVTDASPTNVTGVTDTKLGAGLSDIYAGILTTPNNAYPVLNPNGSYYGNANYLANLQAQSTGTGYNAGYQRDILTDIYLKRTLDEIVQGLWIKAKVSYSSTLSEKLSRVRNLVVFKPSGNGYTQFGTVVLQRNTNGILNQGRSNYAELSAGYAHTFQQKHDIDVLLMANRDNNVFTTNTNGEYLPYTVSGGAGKVSYNYNKKYVIEGAFAYNGSNRYPEGNSHTRYGFFPSVGAAWNITNEKFAENINWLNALKLYGSFGKSGWDNPGYYTYLQRYNNNSQSFFGATAGGSNTLVPGTLANQDVTWEKADKLTVGLQGNLIKNRLGFTVEYYYNKFSDLIQQRGRSTGIIGTTFPNENIGRNLYKGFDFQLSWQETKKSFDYFISANATVQKSKVLFADEVNQPYDYMKRTGNTVGRGFGYVADGLFQSQSEIIGASTFLGYIPQPGDIRYKDLNADGFINQLDQKAIGTSKPSIYFGVSLGFSVRGLDISALFQGNANRDIYLPSNGNAFYEFQNGGLGQAYESSLDRWTPNNTSASYPRLSIGNNTNNQIYSTYWLRKGDFVRLKNLEMGYTLPVKFTSKASINAVRIFANGVNLVTWSGLQGGRDPEVFGSYPIQRVINFGINIKL